MNDWKLKKIGDMVEINVNNINKDFRFNEIEYLETSSITENKIFSLSKIDINEAPSRAKRIVKNEDIIYSLVRPINRHYGFINNPPSNLIVSTGFAVISCHKDIIYPKFLYYYLTQDFVVEELDSIAEGSTSAYPSLVPSDIEKIELYVPNIEQQKTISSILSSLDNKIDILRRQNSTLEKIAETLFRQWFIVDAKDDWEEVQLDEYIDCVNGVSYRSEDLCEYSENALVTLKCFKLDGSFSVDGYKSYNGSFKLSQQVDIYDLVIAHTDITQNANVIGNVGIVNNKFGYDNLIISMDLVKVIPKSILPKEFLYYLLKSNDFKEHCKGYANGSTVLHLNKRALPEFNFKFPPLDKVLSYSNIVNTYMNKEINNISQIHILEKLRDTLLPKLMSGEIRVRCNEEF